MSRIPLFALVYAFLYCSALFAAPIEETIYFQGNPSLADVRAWNNAPSRNYRVALDSTFHKSVAPLTELKTIKKLQVMISSYPNADDVDVFSNLAHLGAELVLLDPPWPMPNQIERLNQIGFKKTILLLPFYPSKEMASTLNQIRSELHITFTASQYPRSFDKLFFRALSPQVTTLFAMDYWPYYNQMDVLNLIDQPRRLRIRGGSFPSDDSLDYLYHIKNLREIAVEDVTFARDADWLKIARFDLEWITQNVPSRQSLEQFKSSASNTNAKRKLTLHRDIELTQDEIELLQNSQVNVEWIKSHSRR